MNLFETAVEALGLEAYRAAAHAYYNNTENLQKIIQTLGLNSFDDGKVLLTSTSEVHKFMTFSDRLYEHLNSHLDSLAQGDAMLAALLETDTISADRFIPDIRVTETGELNRVSAQYRGLGLSLTFTGSVDADLTGLLDGQASDMFDGLMVESEPQILGSMVIFWDGTLQWTPYVEEPVTVEEPMLPDAAESPKSRRARLESI